jgi:hypothetical protein
MSARPGPERRPEGVSTARRAAEPATWYLFSVMAARLIIPLETLAAAGWSFRTFAR